MSLDLAQYLSEVKQSSPRLAVALQNIEDAINQVAAVTGVDTDGHLPAPDPPTSINVKAGNGLAHITLTDTSPRSRSLNYFVEASTDPNFLPGKTHVEHLGVTRERFLALPGYDDAGNPQVWNFRAYSMYPGSTKRSGYQTLGGDPTEVNVGGIVQFTPLPSVGSGTSSTTGTPGEGFGDAQYSSLDRPAEIQGGTPAPLTSIPVVGELVDGSGSPGAPGQVLSSTGTGTAWVSGGSGSVTSVGLSVSVPSFLSESVTGSPVTSSGTIDLTLSLATQAEHLVFVGPASGPAADPTFRLLMAADLPSDVAYLDAIQTFTAAQAFDSTLMVGDELLDGLGSPGSSGYVLSSTGTGVKWIATGGSGSVTEVDTAGIATGGPITTTGTVTVLGSGNTDTAATAATDVAGAPSGDVITADGSGNVKDSGVLLSSLLVSPLTTKGDILYENATPAPARLAIGSSGQVLTVSSGLPAWENATGFANPMTTLGDMIYENATPAPVRLAIGSSGQVLTVSAGSPAWATPATAGGGAVVKSGNYLALGTDLGSLLAFDTGGTTGYSFVQTTTSSSTTACTLGSTPSTGDLLLAVFYNTNNSAITVTGGGVVGNWSNMGGPTQIGSSGIYLSVYYGVVGASPSKTISASGNATYDYVAWDFSGGSGVLDGVGVVNVGTSTNMSASVPVTDIGDLVFAWLGTSAGSGTFTVNAGFTSTPSTGSANNWQQYDATLSSTGTATPGITFGSSAAFTVIAGAFLPTAGVTYTLTLPASIPSSKWWIYVENFGTGTLVVSPNGLLLDDNGANISLHQNEGCYITTDGSNYFTSRGILRNGTTGTGEFVLQTSPTLVTPTLGVASGTSLSLSGALELATGQVLSWNSDTGLSRASAKVIDVGNGSAGDASGTVNAAQYNVAGSQIATTNLSDVTDTTWTPTATSLTQAGGTAVITGHYTRIGNLVFFTINVALGTSTSTSSVANSTSFSLPSGLPAARNTVCYATDNNVASFGNGQISGNQVYTPTWTTVTTAIQIAGTYELA